MKEYPKGMKYHSPNISRYIDKTEVFEVKGNLEVMGIEGRYCITDGLGSSVYMFERWAKLAEVQAPDQKEKPKKEIVQLSLF